MKRLLLMAWSWLLVKLLYSSPFQFLRALPRLRGVLLRWSVGTSYKIRKIDERTRP